MKNLPFQVMQEFLMVRCSFKLPVGLEDIWKFSASFFMPTFYHLLHEELECGALLGCLLDCFDLYYGLGWCKIMCGEIQPLNLNLFMWADSAECICHRYLRTWNVLNGEIIGLNFQW